MSAHLTSTNGISGPTVTRHLVIADMGRQYPLTPSVGAPVLVAQLAERPDSARRSLEFLKSELSTVHSVAMLGAEGTAIFLEPPSQPMAAWSHSELTKEFGAYLRSVSAAADGTPELTPRDLSCLGPVMLLRTHAAADRPYTEVLMCARVRTIGTLFVKVGEFAHAKSAGLAERVIEGFRKAGHLQNRVLTEGNAYHTYEKGVEIEEKITLSEDLSIWALTTDIWTAVEHGEFPDFIPDPGYELTRWHFVQHNFEVVGSDGSQGHYSFLDNPDGGYYLRMKNFAADALRRAEAFRQVEVSGDDFDSYLAHEFPDLKFRRLPTFLRTRFDINVHSVTTGHCFGIETDEVTLVDGSERKLRQVEMEYLQTWWHSDMSATSIDAELSRLTELVEAHLTKRGIATSRGFYSKLAFLREHA